MMCILYSVYPPKELTEFAADWEGAGFKLGTMTSQSGALPLSHLSSFNPHPSIKEEKSAPPPSRVGVAGGEWAFPPVSCYLSGFLHYREREPPCTKFPLLVMEQPCPRDFLPLSYWRRRVPRLLQPTSILWWGQRISENPGPNLE